MARRKITPWGELTDDGRETLTKILVSIDVLFLPFRFGQNQGPNNVCCAIMHRRIDYFDQGGIEFVGGGSVAQRKSSGRLLESLCEAGWIDFRSASTRGYRVRFSEFGDYCIRELFGCCPAIYDRFVWDYLRVIPEFIAEEKHNTGFVNEEDLIEWGGIESEDDRQELERNLLHLLVLGYLESYSDVIGRVGYGIEPSGQAMVDSGRKPRRPRNLPEFDKSLPSEYMKHFRGAWKDRTTWRHGDNHVAISLSCGMWG